MAKPHVVNRHPPDTENTFTPWSPLRRLSSRQAALGGRERPIIRSISLNNSYSKHVLSSEETRAQEGRGGMSTSGKLHPPRGADKSWECHPPPRLMWSVKAPYRPQYQRNKRKRAGKRRSHYKPSLFFYEGKLIYSKDLGINVNSPYTYQWPRDF